VKKIPRVFKMDPNNKALCLPEPTPGCEWVLAGEGIATRKYDGTSCLIRTALGSIHPQLYKRYDAKNGKTPPEGWTPCEEAPDEVTGHWPGWLLVSETAPEDWMHRAVFEGTMSMPITAYEDGTYELCGPKLGKNPEKLERYVLIRHGQNIHEVFRDYDGIRGYLAITEIEGLVFHHPDGRMAKIRRKDFGFQWPQEIK